MEEAKKEIEERLRAEFAASADLQVEFGDVKAYIAFKMADAQGRIRGLKSSVPARPAGGA